MKIKILLSWLTLIFSASVFAQHGSEFALPMPALPPEIISPPKDTSQQPILVRAINTSGNKKTKQYLIDREIAVKTGILYEPVELYKQIRLSREQLMNTTLFVTVDITIDTLLPDEVDINIILRERWYLFPIPYFRLVDRNINVWLNDYKASLDRTEYGAKVVHNNTTGRNDKMNLILIGGYSQQIVANYYQPFVDKKLRQGFGVGFNYARAREVNYATDSNRQQFFSLPDFAREFLRAELTYSYRKGSQMRSFLRLSYNTDEVDSIIVDRNPKIFGNGITKATFVDLSANYQYLNVDYIPYPLRGWMVDFFAIKRFSRSIPMFQVGGKMQAAWKFAPKSYVNFQGAFAATISSKAQPFYNSRMLGYRSLYMQGLELYVADGNMAAMVRTTLRRQMLAFTIKNLVRSKSHSEIPFQFFLKTYGNLGYAYNKNPGNNFMNNQLLHTAGFGVDIVMIYDVVLKLEYSFNQFGGRGFFIHTATDF
jgi:hypothetical protein